MKRISQHLTAFLILVILLTGCGQLTQTQSISLDQVPDYSGQAYVTLENGQPDFSAEDLESGSFEEYSPLDLLGRCGTAYARIGPETMPTEERGAIGQVKPSGWHLVKYDCVDGKYLYNRCHLIGYQLAGENANEKNLITGTRYLNVVGMLPFENQVAAYVQETGNHVLYRVTPVFSGTELVARGVQMEAMSVEDRGGGVCFNVYVYNVQPGVEIDYATGESWLASEQPAAEEPPAPEQSGGLDAPQQEEQREPDGAAQEEASGTEASREYGEEQTYVLNLRSLRFHYPDCAGVATMSENNKQLYTGSREDLLEQGYVPCGQCQP